MKRRGMGKGLGTGYKNLVMADPYVHSLSAKGVKSYTKLNARTVVEKFKVYKFDELPTETQEKLLDKYREVNVEDTWWADSDIDYLKEEASKLGFDFDAKDVEWAILSRDSKVGVTSKAISIDFEKILGKKMIADLEKKYDAEMDYEWLPRLVGNFSPYEVLEIKFREYGGKSGRKIVPERVKEQIKDKVYKNLDEFISLTKQTYKDLIESYEYQTSDEAVKDMLENNYGEFTVDGKPYMGSGQEVLTEQEQKR